MPGCGQPILKMLRVGKASVTARPTDPASVYSSARMVGCRSAALLLALVLAGLGAGNALAAIPTLTPTPPTPLTPAAPRAHAHHHRTPAPAAVATTPTITSSRPAGSLPMTGVDLPLELGVAGLLVATGLGARFAGRGRRHRY
jgi:hypothetical protein